MISGCLMTLKMLHLQRKNIMESLVVLLDDIQKLNAEFCSNSYFLECFLVILSTKLVSNSFLILKNI